METKEPSHGFRSTFSNVDASVNWVRAETLGQLETRYVRRGKDYFALYLSSQTGCRQACRMCHLTATGQVKLQDAGLNDYLQQADVVLAHHTTQPPAVSVHYNFMARGEPLANPVMLSESGELFNALWHKANDQQLRARFLVSTIFPKCSASRPLEDIFGRYQPEIYYSLYSTNPAFRKRWLPNAQPVNEALARLAAWQRHSYKLIKIHYAFIAGQNDSEADVHAVCDAIEAVGLYVHINIVRYNPPSTNVEQESDEKVIERNAAIFARRFPLARVKVIPRVGFDVQASCGMFVSRERR